jgi:hypothetical protein
LRDRQLAVGAVLLGADDDLVATGEDDGLFELADPQLRPLQVGDQRYGMSALGLDLADAPHDLRVLLVLAVREVETRRIHAGGDERAQTLGRL